MGLKLITDATAEPVSLSEAKAHLRVTSSAEDALITAMIVAARQACEHKLGRALITQTWEKTLDSFPDAIELPRPPAIAITSVKYYDTANVLQTLSGSLYTLDLDSEPGWVLPALGSVWPDTAEVANAVRVRYTAGYGVDSTFVPGPVKAWIYLMLATLFEHREAFTAGVEVKAAPFADRLLDRYTVPRL